MLGVKCGFDARPVAALTSCFIQVRREGIKTINHDEIGLVLSLEV